MLPPLTLHPALSPPASGRKARRRPPAPSMGILYTCDARTLPICLSAGVFGAATAAKPLQSAIQVGTTLLFLLEGKAAACSIYGPFVATAPPGRDLRPVFEGKYREQVLVRPLLPLRCIRLDALVAAGAVPRRVPPTLSPETVGRLLAALEAQGQVVQA